MDQTAREGRFRKQIARPEYERLRNELRLEIERAGVSQRELSARLGMRSSYVNKIVMGQRTVELGELLDILSALEVDPIEFLGRIVG